MRMARMVSLIGMTLKVRAINQMTGEGQEDGDEEGEGDFVDQSEDSENDHEDVHKDETGISSFSQFKAASWFPLFFFVQTNSISVGKTRVCSKT